MSDVAVTAQEHLASLRQTIGEAEIQAAVDMNRYDRECEQRKRDRWQRMISETRDLRGLCDAILKALADVEMAKPISITAPTQPSI